MTAQSLVAPLGRRRPLRPPYSYQGEDGEEEDAATLPVCAVFKPPRQGPRAAAAAAPSPNIIRQATQKTKKSVRFAAHAGVSYFTKPPVASSADDQFFSPQQEAQRLHQHYERLVLASEWRQAGYACLLHQQMYTHPHPRFQAALNAHVLLADQLHDTSSDDSVRGMEDYLRVAAVPGTKTAQWALLREAVRQAHRQLVLKTHRVCPEQVAHVSRQQSAPARYFAHQVAVADRKAVLDRNADLVAALRVLCQACDGSILYNKMEDNTKKQVPQDDEPAATRRRLGQRSLLSWLWGEPKEEQATTTKTDPAAASGPNGMEWLFLGALAPLLSQGGGAVAVIT